MVHCSFDPVDRFVLRIPEQRIEGKYPEDDKTARICVSSDITKALRAIPQAGIVMTYMRQLGLPVIIHAYYLKADNYYKPTVAEVPDVNWTDEYWLLSPPDSVYRKDYEVVDFQTSHGVDLNGKDMDYIIKASMKPAKYQDNMLNLCNAFHVDYNKFPKRISFRTFMANCGNEIIKILRKHDC